MLVLAYNEEEVGIQILSNYISGVNTVVYVQVSSSKSDVMVSLFR